MIDLYSFGRIVIDGREYSSDVIIYPEKIDSGWWRREGHVLGKEDLEEVFDHAPELLIVGTGAHGKMKVPQETQDYIESMGIELRILKTREACDAYNELKDEKKVVAALHLTC